MVELSQAGAGLYRRGFAGDVVNTLCYARRALPGDWEVAFHTGLGTDRESEEMAAFLASIGIDAGGALRVPDRRPGLYMIHLDGAERSFSYWRDRSAARLLASDPAALDAALALADAVYLSGITLAILPAADRDRLMEALAGFAGLVAFDPNVRPALWDDLDEMRVAVTAAAARAELVLPTFDDEAAAFGDAEPAASAARYRTRPEQTVLVKDGPRPVHVLGPGGTAVVDTPPVTDAVDTTGAGDAFNGAALAALLTGAEPEAAVRAGQAMAARVIRHHGAILPPDAPA
jgi:2-dehydro-3-deoxygluconokinase